MLTSKKVAVAAILLSVIATPVLAQQTSTYTNRWGDSVTDTRTLANGQYTNDKTVTTPAGRTYTNDETALRNSSGRPEVQRTLTTANGETRSATTTYGRFGRKTTATGPNGHSRTFFRRR